VVKPKSVANAANKPAAPVRQAISTSQQASTLGSWSAPASLCAPDGACLVGANAAVLPGNQVLFYFYPTVTSPSSIALLLNIATGQLTDVTVPFTGASELDIFCSGISIMPNGQVLVTGGSNLTALTSHSGTVNTTIFDPVAGAWWAGSNMIYARWYPSTVELADGTMLEVAGDDVSGGAVATPESYNYTTNTWSALPASANLPSTSLHITAYPRLVLLPSGNVFMPAPDAMTYQFNPVANTWYFVAATKFGFRFYAPHVLLNGLQRVLVAGGTSSEASGGQFSTNTAEVIDFSVAHPAWSYTGSMTYPRVNENLVLLQMARCSPWAGGVVLRVTLFRC